MQTLVWSELTASERAAALTRPAQAQAAIETSAREIVTRVREDGDAALVALTEELDRVRLADLAVGPDEFAAAARELTDTQRQAILRALATIQKFHRAQLNATIQVETEPGVRCERVSRPLDRVGLYVPAGSAPLPSTALMLAVPAALAGCPEVIMTTPPRPDGNADAAVLFAAQAAGVHRVFKIGGAQAIAALAFGTESVPRVAKIFGPGNAWVTAAKAAVGLDPDGAAIDMPAGPSEVLVIADSTADPVFVATDLLSQAEHGPDSQVLLVTDSEQLLNATVGEVERLTEKLTRKEMLRASLAHSAAVLVEDLETAVALSNAYAPEHLILQVKEPRRWLADVVAAGSVFLGPWAPEAVGDYCSGTNHVLPTYGFARSFSSLGTADFERRMTVQELTPAGIRTIGPVATTLAELEGLDAHALAVNVRLDKLGERE